LYLKAFISEGVGGYADTRAPEGVMVIEAIEAIEEGVVKEVFKAFRAQ
jgi:hypothetical protein